jgi:ribonuclease P protein component
MSEPRKTFCKEERLCSVKAINLLFEEGNVFYTGHFKVVWQLSNTPQSFPARTGFSVSKKGFKLAVSRNLIKRRMREAWRKNKSKLYDHLEKKQQHILIFFVFRSSVIPDYSSIDKSVNDAIVKLISLI